MEVTFRLTDLLLILLTGCAGAATFYAVSLMRRLDKALGQWQRTAERLEELLPHAQRLCVTSEEAMASVRALADRGTQTVDDVAQVTTQLREAAEEGLAHLHGLLSTLKSASLLLDAFRAGVDAVRDGRADDPQNTAPPEGPSEE